MESEDYGDKPILRTLTVPFRHSNLKWFHGPLGVERGGKQQQHQHGVGSHRETYDPRRSGVSQSLGRQALATRGSSGGFSGCAAGGPRSRKPRSLPKLLCGLGIHGLLSLTVSRRSHEIGVRLALGAPSRGAVRMVLKEGLLVALLIGCIRPAVRAAAVDPMAALRSE